MVQTALTTKALTNLLTALVFPSSFNHGPQMASLESRPCRTLLSYHFSANLFI